MFGIEILAGGSSYLDSNSYPLTVTGKTTKTLTGPNVQYIDFTTSERYDLIAIMPKFSVGSIGGWLNGHIKKPELYAFGAPRGGVVDIYFLQFMSPSKSYSNYGIEIISPDKGIVFSTDSGLCGITYIRDALSTNTRGLRPEEALLITQGVDLVWESTGSPPYGTMGGHNSVNLSSGRSTPKIFGWIESDGMWGDALPSEFTPSPTIYIKIPDSHR